MKTWFVCKAKYQKENEQGIIKNVTEAYLVDAFSYTEAEARIYGILEDMIRGEFIITQISKSNINELFHFEGFDIWYKCKIIYYVTDGDSEKEKKITNYILISAETVKDAFEKLEQSMQNLLVTYQVNSIAESNIMEVFPYQPDEEINEPIPDNLKPLSEMGS